MLFRSDVSGMRVLSGLRAAVASFPMSWACPTAEYYARDDSPIAYGGRSRCQYFSACLGPWSPATRRFQHCAVSGLPLPCLRSCIPYAVAAHGEERLGPPTFFDVSLPACLGLRTPADLSILAYERMVLCCLRCAFTPSASATSAFAKLSQHCRVRDHPCGLQDTLSTLRPSCSPCLHDSAMDARLDTGEWLILTRQGLSPCKRRQAFLGAITLALTCCWKRKRGTSGRWKQSGAALGEMPHGQRAPPLTLPWSVPAVSTPLGPRLDQRQMA